MGKVWDAEKYTEKSWSEKFNQMKEEIKVRRLTLLKPKFLENDKQKTPTNYYYYCQYVNDAIREIRAGRTYPVYHEAHIKELVKYFGKYLTARLEGDYWACYVQSEFLPYVKKHLQSGY